MNSIANVKPVVKQEPRTVLVTANGKTKTLELRPEDDVFWRQAYPGGYFEVSRAGEVRYFDDDGQGWGGNADLGLEARYR